MQHIISLFLILLSIEAKKIAKREKMYHYSSNVWIEYTPRILEKKNEVTIFEKQFKLDYEGLCTKNITLYS